MNIEEKLEKLFFKSYDTLRDHLDSYLIHSGSYDISEGFDEKNSIDDCPESMKNAIMSIRKAKEEAIKLKAYGELYLKEDLPEEGKEEMKKVLEQAENIITQEEIFYNVCINILNERKNVKDVKRGTPFGERINRYFCGE